MKEAHGHCLSSSTVLEEHFGKRMLSLDVGSIQPVRQRRRYEQSSRDPSSEAACHSLGDAQQSAKPNTPTTALKLLAALLCVGPAHNLRGPPLGWCGRLPSVFDGTEPSSRFSWRRFQVRRCGGEMRFGGIGWDGKGSLGSEQ